MPRRVRSWFLPVILCLVATAATAGTFSIVAPRNFVRATGAPVTERVAFAASNTSLPYTLRVEDGGTNGTMRRVSAAVIRLNGVELLGVKDFNSRTPVVIEKSVTLAASNELTVEVRGEPGSGLTLRILAQDNDAPRIVATVSPAAMPSGWNASDVTVTFTCSDPTSSVPNCPGPVHVTPQGETIIERSVTDAAGNTASTSVAVRIDYEPPSLNILDELPGLTNAPAVTVRGTTSDLSGVALTINGAVVPVVDDLFTAEVPLVDGENTISIVSRDLAGSVSTLTGRVDRYTIPVVAITSPADLAVVRAVSVTVSGTVSTPNAAVVVNGVSATVSGNTFTATGVPLAQGRTVVTANATTAAGNSGSGSILVYRDSIPPRVTLRAPVDGATVYQSPVDVAGTVDDIVVGTINSGQVTVTVNGTPAEVSNRGFVARSIALTPGINTLTVVATDQGGNSFPVTARVTYQTAAGQAKIAAVSGNGQAARIGTELAQPLVVRLFEANGAPAAARPVSFEVVENNGSLRSGTTSGRSLTVNTDIAGQASVFLALGTRAGAGNNRVVARAAGFTGTAEFQATSRLGEASMIVVDSGNTQFGATGAPLPRPLIAVVVDSGSNRLAGVPVTFSAIEGEGRFGASDMITVTTDSDGRAIATPTIGSIGTNVYIAAVGNLETPATFLAFGKLAGPPSETRISGVVLDNTDLAIAGVTIRVDGTTLTTQSDDQGQFFIPNAPVGYVKLLVDGSTARRPGTWPTLEYAMYTIPGANNTLEMPVYLLPLDVRRGLFVDEVTGGTLTIPEMPGFALTVKPGSATFPGGGRTGTVSVTLVHADKMPMAPGFGQQPRFIVTIQPPGVHFDPPAAISFPNVDGLTPGEVTEMYSFDHDLGQFVSIGTASASYDGTILSSDPGVGIIKGGWHCGGNPPPGGTPNCCPKCKKCNGTTCVIDTAQNGQNCETSPPPSPWTRGFQFGTPPATYSVTITIDESCGKRCTGSSGNPCALPSNRWGYNNLLSQAQYAVGRILDTNCLGPITRNRALTSIGNANIVIKCINQPNMPGTTGSHCGYAGVGNNGAVTLTNSPQSACGSVGKTILHEILHSFAGIPHMTLPGGAVDCSADIIHACDQNCFGFSTACGPTNNQPNPLCN